MCNVLNAKRLYEGLTQIDQELAEQVHAGGCLYCGGKLHRGNYPRKPRGGPREVMDRWAERASFCCEREGCRKRHTPPSVRFLGRKVYVGVVVVLVAAMMHGANARRVGQLQEALGIDARTLKRWRQWWLDRFVHKSFWKAHRARFLPALNEAVMPYCLVEAFGAQRQQGVIKLMRFLAPITTSSCPEGMAM